MNRQINAMKSRNGFLMYDKGLISNQCGKDGL